jgi:hypothetical protein
VRDGGSSDDEVVYHLMAHGRRTRAMRTIHDCGQLFCLNSVVIGASIGKVKNQM